MPSPHFENAKNAPKKIKKSASKPLKISFDALKNAFNALLVKTVYNNNIEGLQFFVSI
jgi:hypothetical protein